MSIKIFKKIFDDNHILFWLDFGTLLGIMRNGELIAWDRDFDIGIFRKDYDKVEQLIPVFEKHGFIVDHNHSIDNLQFKKDNYKFDINIYEKQDSCFVHYWNVHNVNLFGRVLDGIIKRLCYLYRKHGSTCVCSSISMEYFLSFDTVVYMGLKWNIPSNVSNYLGLHYGNWLKPVKDWDWINDDGTIQRI